MKYLLIISLIITFCTAAMAQEVPYVSYTYDHAGNRKSRVLFLPVNTSSATTIGTIAQIQNNSALSQTAPDSAALTGTTQQPTYNDLVSGHAVAIFPNPTQGLLKINISNLKITGADKITIYDLTGKTWLEKTVTDANTDLDISNRPAGTYFMKLYVSGEETVWTIVKQ